MKSNIFAPYFLSKHYQTLNFTLENQMYMNSDHEYHWDC